MRQHILQMGVLNDNIRHLPTLKDSSKAVPMMRKGNIPFGEADLATIMLSSVPMLWQNQYNLNHLMILKSTCTLLPDLEAIKRVMEKRRAQTSRQRQRAVQPQLKPRVTLSAKRPGDQLVESLRKVAVRSFASNARPMAVLSRCTTPWTAVATTATASPSRL